MKVLVDQDRCVGHGICEMKAPDVFAIGDDGVSYVLVDEISDDHRDAVADAVASCPSQALRLTD
ncbi:ferredoxin [Mycolicibacter heraklionensis]|uniref:Ferredoxin n=1 Tax=Mycolicibacter heraklionensis TaxID=512402 RepID=A0A9X7WF59_9MYCO|nr:ferredoxin [Mycolicibacter heraklionensis]QZA06961.1 ferredoxin [Mycolicibacter heraklionensis]